MDAREARAEVVYRCDEQADALRGAGRANALSCRPEKSRTAFKCAAGALIAAAAAVMLALSVGSEDLVILSVVAVVLMCVGVVVISDALLNAVTGARKATRLVKAADERAENGKNAFDEGDKVTLRVKGGRALLMVNDKARDGFDASAAECVLAGGSLAVCLPDGSYVCFSSPDNDISALADAFAEAGAYCRRA